MSDLLKNLVLKNKKWTILCRWWWIVTPAVADGLGLRNGVNGMGESIEEKK
jgi:hypothetical protein